MEDESQESALFLGSSRGWRVTARVGEEVGNEESGGGVCRGKRSGYCPGEQLFLV